MKELMREDIRALMPYDAPFRMEGIKLDANENTYPVLQALREHMAAWIMEAPLNYYPDTKSDKLREAIAQNYGLTKANVVCGVGSDQIIDCLLRAYVEKDDKVLAPVPSFSMYKLSTKLNGGEFKEVPLGKDFVYDTEAFCDAVVKYQPKIVFICNPNNPTGTLISMEELSQVIEKSKGIVVIDEAYAEFHEEVGVELMKQYDNVVVLRTFSKAYGLAGARLGYALGSEALIQCIEAIKPPYNLNVFAQEAGCYVMENRQSFKEAIDRIKRTRDDVREKLLELGMEVAPSATNFLWIQTNLPLESLLEEIATYIKGFTYQNKSYYRMSIGTDEEMQKVIAKIKETLESRTKEGER